MSRIRFVYQLGQIAIPVQFVWDNISKSDHSVCFSHTRLKKTTLERPRIAQNRSLHLGNRPEPGGIGGELVPPVHCAVNRVVVGQIRSRFAGEVKHLLPVTHILGQLMIVVTVPVTETQMEGVGG